MMLDCAWLLRAALALLPALCFLGALLVLDSYKLVRPRRVVGMLAAGGAMAGISYCIGFAMLQATGLGFPAYSRFVAPLVEESLKAAVVVALIRTRRIGFLSDAALLGYAVGTGFATIENLYYLDRLAAAPIGVWVVRGFGTAILHGGAQAIFAALALANTDRRGEADARALLPPLLLAVAVHAAFNSFVLPPIQQTLLVLVLMPPLMLWVFKRSERAVEGWIGAGFDTDGELMRLLESGTFSQSHAGQYLVALRDRFAPEIVFDLFCYLRLYAELALRAKGLLLMRENGIAAPPCAEVGEKLRELRHLEHSVGPTALHTLQPLMHISRRDLWQMRMLGE